MWYHNIFGTIPYMWSIWLRNFTRVALQCVTMNERLTLKCSTGDFYYTLSSSIKIDVTKADINNLSIMKLNRIRQLLRDLKMKLLNCIESISIGRI